MPGREVGALIDSLFLKRRRGEPMVSATHLDLDTVDGMIAATSRLASSPRQVCVTTTGSLARNGVAAQTSRANIVLSGPESLLGSGDKLTFGAVVMRICFLCEACAHGAQLSGVPMAQFRRLRRFLAVVVRPGRVTVGSPMAVAPACWEAVADTFAARCSWALDRIPPGQSVTSLDFLTAIGAARTHARVLPRWMTMARRAGKPVHRVITAQLNPPSWAMDAHLLLKEEGGDGWLGEFPLCRELWFAGRSVPKPTSSTDLSS